MRRIGAGWERVGVCRVVSDRKRVIVTERRVRLRCGDLNVGKAHGILTSYASSVKAKAFARSTNNVCNVAASCNGGAKVHETVTCKLIGQQ